MRRRKILSLLTFRFFFYYLDILHLFHSDLLSHQSMRERRLKNLSEYISIRLDFDWLRVSRHSFNSRKLSWRWRHGRARQQGTEGEQEKERREKKRRESTFERQRHTAALLSLCVRAREVNNQAWIIDETTIYTKIAFSSLVFPSLFFFGISFSSSW